MIKTSCLLFILSAFSSFAFAQEGVHTSIHHLYQAPRALGMGGAFVAVADDYSSLMYNPAGMARLEEGQTNLSMDFSFSGAQVKSFYDDLNTASQSTQNSTAKFNAILAVLQANYGKQYTFRGGLFEAISVHPGWGFAVLPADMTIDVKVNNNVVPTLNLRTYLDTTLAIGIGRKIKSVSIPGRLAWGVTGKFVNRGYANKMLNSLDMVTDSEIFKPTDYRWGYTVDLDVGLLYTPIIPTDGLFSIFRTFRPTFGLVGRNLIDAGFGQSLAGMNKTPVTAPEQLYRTFDFGMKFEMPNLWIFGARVVADVTDIGHPNFNLHKGMHLGYEFDWRVSSWWRGQYRIGVNQGYMSMGASFLLSVFRLDLVSYSEDIGSYSSTKENRLYMAKFNLDW